MSEKINDKTVFSLLEVTQSIQKTIAERYKNTYWIKAEMHKLNFYSHSGHCYPELVEKQNGKIISQIRSNLRKSDYQVINNKFLDILKEPLKDGIKILFLAKISFDPVYGAALQIVDIDPGYTLGDLEKEKQETIDQLKKEGIYDRNKQLSLPLLPQRIAIISVDTSKGYADFLKILDNNGWNYQFFHLLFPSLLQGEKAVSSIIGQLQRIKKIKEHFDVVAIIRGGGGDIGLSCYNNYELAREIALFPIPVLTGIGHATNETVAEIISFSNAITPTKLAEYLIQHFHNFSVPVQKAQEKIIDLSKRLIEEKKLKFHAEVKLLRLVTGGILNNNRNQVKEQASSLSQYSLFRFRNEKSNIGASQETIRRESLVLCSNAKQDIRQLAINLKKDTVSQIYRAKFLVDQKKQLTESSLGKILSDKKQVFARTTGKLAGIIPVYIKNESSVLSNIEKNINNMSPVNVLKRGYSITLYKGKALLSNQEIKVGDQLQTILLDGTISSTVQTSTKTNPL